MKEKNSAQNELQQILIDRDWGLLREKVIQNRDIVRQLSRRTYVNDGLLFWRAVEAIGIAAEAIELQRLGFAAELILPLSESPDPQLRGRAVLVKALIPDWDELIDVAGKQKYLDDCVEIELYFNDQLRSYTIAELYRVSGDSNFSGYPFDPNYK